MRKYRCIISCFVHIKPDVFEIVIGFLWEYKDLSQGYQPSSIKKIIYIIFCEQQYQDYPFSDLCLEKRAFYRAVSGLHSSINIHLCARYLLSGVPKTFLLQMV